MVIDLDRASMEDFRNMAAALADAEARLAAVEDLAASWAATDKTGLPPSPLVFANHAAALRAALRADPPEATTWRECDCPPPYANCTHPPPGPDPSEATDASS